MSIELPQLPYSASALEPFMSRSTLELHWGKHHRAYVDAVNSVIDGTEMAGWSLEQIIDHAAGSTSTRQLYNNAAQAWNHAFFWRCLAPGGGPPPGYLLSGKVSRDFGSFDAFTEQFSDAARRHFGSGWIWLVLEDGELSIKTTQDAESPRTADVAPIVTIDLWEHAYYLDYANRRGEYVAVVLARLINWDFAGRNLEAALRENRLRPLPRVDATRRTR